MTLNQIKTFAVSALLLAIVFGCTTETKIDYHLHRASVDISKAYRQFQLADNAFYNDNDNAAMNHLSSGMDLFQTALDHLSKAEDDAYEGASNEIDNGNSELQKSMDEYNNGNVDSAEKHYDKALNHYDKALDLLDYE